ncbi:MAG: recombinase RecT, partial [Chloroflexi bacterium]|nr:recombinase RecT [Chloroflexota bacterium]
MPQNRKQAMVTLQGKVNTLITAEQAATLATHGLDAPAFAAVAQAALLHTPDIVDCTPISVMKAMRKACLQGLMPDTREGALVAFKNRDGVKEANFIAMKEGLQRLFTQATGATLQSGVIRKGDTYEIATGAEPNITVVPNLEAEDDAKVIAAWAMAIMPNGSRHLRVLPLRDLRKIQQASRARNGPWKTWEDRMQEKS